MTSSAAIMDYLTEIDESNPSSGICHRVGCLKADETTRGVAIVGWPINISDQTRDVEYS